MKILLLILILIGIASPIFAKARYAQKKDMIKEAELIVIVNITKVEKTAKGGAVWAYRQKATATIEQCLKGNEKGNITIYGYETFQCAHCLYKKGRFILFLKKDGDLWVGSNWQAGIFPIKNDNVLWFKDDESWETKDVPLKKVIDEINTVVKEQKEETPNKPDEPDKK